MGCIRSLSRIWGKWALLLGVAFCSFQANKAEANFATRFSLTTGEEFSDNIFFTKQKDHDFITNIIPTLSFYYAPAGEATPTANLNISPGGQIFARHSDLNNFGKNTLINGGLSYLYSPRLQFHLSDSFERLGSTRLPGIFSGFGSGFSVPPTPTSPPPVAGGNPPSAAQNLANFISSGSTITNALSLSGAYRFSEKTSITGQYSHSVTDFIDAGGTDSSQTFGARGIYNWRQQHNLHAGYFITISKSRNGDSNVTHNFDLGDDYFGGQVIPLAPGVILKPGAGASVGTGGTGGTGSNVLEVQVTPTLSLSASTGLSIATGSGGIRLGNNSTVTITKLWETATLTGGVRKGFTPSFGVSGISDTTSLFTLFNIRLSERLSGTASVDYSLFDTQDVNFTTFEGRLSFQYLFTTWLASNLSYSYRSSNSGAGAASTNLLERGKVSANDVFLSLTASFDLWPNVGLARSLTSPTLTPILRTPFPMVAPVAAPSQP